ncbi:hypothetical protein ACF3NX_07425 [Acetobacter orientalis]|uniref:hypothetical protein n=1 Tax=Acetobacter orientalis TaxID=146474 RepID=UPI003862D9E4
MIDDKELKKMKGEFENIKKSYNVFIIAWQQARYKYIAWRLISNNENNSNRIFSGKTNFCCSGYNLIATCVINDLLISLVKMFEIQWIENPKTKAVKTLSLFYIFHFIFDDVTVSKIEKKHKELHLCDGPDFNFIMYKLKKIKEIIESRRFQSMIKRNREFRNKITGHYDIDTLLNPSEIKKPLYDEMKYMYIVSFWCRRWLGYLIEGEFITDQDLNNKGADLSLLSFFLGVRVENKKEENFFKDQLNKNIRIEDISFPHQ